MLVISAKRSVFSQFMFVNLGFQFPLEGLNSPLGEFPLLKDVESFAVSWRCTYPDEMEKEINI